MNKRRKVLLSILMILFLLQPVCAATTKKCTGILIWKKCTVSEPTGKPNSINEMTAPDCIDTYGGVYIKDGQVKVLPQCDVEETFDNEMARSTNQLIQIFFYVWNGSLIIAMISLATGGVQLAYSRGNPQSKQKAWGRIRISLIVVALLGGLETIVLLFFGLFR